jgi:gliding motility-associated-like protein
MKNTILFISLFLFSIAVNAQTILINPAGDGGFETGSTLAANGWTVVDANAVTWFVGNAAGIQGGTNAAFVGSNATTYTGSTVAVVKHFYRDVVIPAGATQVYLNYYLKMPLIDNTYDYFYIYTNTTAQTPVSGALPAGTQRVAYTTPALAGFSAGTQIDLTSLAGTTVRLVFTYKTDAVSPYANPAIDNISLTCTLPTPVAPVFYNASANGTSVFFDNIRAVTNPIFAISSTGSAYNAMQIEVNTKDDFTGTAYTQTISGTYVSGTKYDFVCNNLSPALPSTDPAVYYARARASSDAGGSWGSWSSQNWTFTHSATDYGWHQTAKAQFNEGTFTGNFIQSTTAGTLSDNVYMNRGSFTEYVASSADDGVWENSTWYPSSAYSTIGYQDDCNGPSNIYDVLRFSNVSIPRNSNVLTATIGLYGTTDCVCENLNSTIYTKISGHNHGSADAPALTSAIATTTSNRTAVNTLWLQSTAWTSGTQYSSPDISNVIDNLVSQATWDEEDHFTLFIDSYNTGTYTANRCISMYDYSSGSRKPSITGTFTDFDNTFRSAMIDFSNFVCSSNYTQLKWTEDETYGSVKVQLYYDNGGVPTIIPDAALAGNSTGLASPVTLTALNTSTYGKLYIIATLRYNSLIAGQSPLLSDWSVTSTPVASVNAGIDQNICAGSGATLTATGCGAYTWSSGQTSASITVNPALTTTYTVTATTGNGNSIADNVQIVVNPAPAITAHPSNQTLCAGGSVSFSALATGGGLSYQWQENTGSGWNNVSNGGIYSGATTNSLTINPATVSMSTYQYQCIVTGSCPPTATSNSATVTINPLPAAYTLSGGGAYCVGGSGAVVGLSNSQSGVNYQLQLNSVNTGSPVAGTGSAISFGNQTSVGIYTVLATNASTSCTNNMTGNVSISVNPLPTTYIVTGGGAYCAGGIGAVVGLSNSQSGINYQLQLNSVNTGSPLAGTGSAISFGNQTSVGIYTVVATNATTSCTNNMTGNVSISINPLPTTYIVTGGGAYCAGGSGAVVGLSNSQSGVNYQLQLNSVNTGSPVAGTGSAISFGNQTSVGIYTVVATNTTTSCTNNMTGNVSISVNPLPTTYIVTGGGAYCAGGSGVAVGLNNSQSGVNYQLQLNSVNTGSPVAGTGSVISFGDQATAGIYTVVATNVTTGCMNAMTGTVSITINSNPIADAGVNDSICPGSNIQLTASGGTFYSWSPATGLNNATIASPVASPLSSVLYTVVVTNSNGCSDTDEIMITVNTLPTANAGNDVSVCFGASTGLNASGGDSYLWSPATGLSNVSIANPVANPANSTIYTVIVTDANGCSDSDNITVNLTSLATANAGSDTSFCEGGNVILNASGGNTYSWSPSSSLSSDSIADPVASPFVTTVYIVTVTDNNGCSGTDQVTVSVNPIPDITISGSVFDNIGYIGNNILFTASPENFDSYIFYQGSLSNPVQSGNENIFEASNLSGPSMIYVVAGNAGCYSLADSILINIKPIPNAFTPNNDSKNERFLNGLELKVLNRWGELLYEGTNGWDGKYKNNDVNDGTYYFIVFLHDKNKNTTEVKGSVTLIRNK